MAEKIELNLISGRTIQQGVSMEAGKEKPAYRDACGIIELNSADLKKLGIWQGTNVRVTSLYGTVLVKAVEAIQNIDEGMGWIPMGPWANRVINPNTYSTGMPTFKGVMVSVVPESEGKVLSSLEVIEEGLAL